MVKLKVGLLNNIERKFIPTRKEILEEYLKNLKYIEEFDIIQTYQNNIKYRCFKDKIEPKYTRNIKQKDITDVKEIDEELFSKVLKENNYKKIQKVRKCYLDGNFKVDVDYFSEPIDMILIEVSSEQNSVDDYKCPKGFIEVTDNNKFQNAEIFKGGIISNNTILEGSDGVGKTTTIAELLKEGIICQDRCIEVISANMLFNIPMEERAIKYQEYLKNIDKKVIIMVNNDREELQKRINTRKIISKFDSLAYEYNELYMKTYEYMKVNNMLENKMFLVDCTGLTIEEQVKAIKNII